MIDCREASELTSRELDRRLGRRQRVALWLHRLLCPACRFYRRQLDSIRRVSSRLGTAAPGADEAAGSTPRLDAAARERLRARLRAATGDKGATEDER
ncbi:MAG: hypothetical protein RLW61_08645 [Gammaproteobacteria bacterium]